MKIVPSILRKDITESEKTLEDLIETTKDEQYYDRAEGTLKKLQEQLSHNKEKDLESYSVYLLKTIRKPNS